MADRIRWGSREHLRRLRAMERAADGEPGIDLSFCDPIPADSREGAVPADSETEGEHYDEVAEEMELARRTKFCGRMDA